MLLKERLMELDNDSYIYVGSESSFVYCGKVENAFDELIDRSKDEFDALRKRIKIQKQLLVAIPKQKDKYVKEIPHLQTELAELKAIVPVDNKQKKLVRDKIITRNNMLKKAKKYVEEYPARMEKIRNYIAALESRKLSFTNFTEREIKDEYDRRIVEPFGKIIIFDGDETGRYWTCEEYAAGNVEEC